MPDHADLVGRETEVDELPAPALRVDDHALEAIEERLPHRRLGQRAARDDVVRGEDGGAARPEEPAIQLRRAEPLQVQHIRLREPEARHAERMLERLHGETQPRSSHAGRERIEPLACLVAQRLGDRSEAESRRHELDLRSGPCECRGQRPVVGRRVGRRVGDDDAHWTGTLDAAVVRIPHVTFEEARAQFPVLDRYAYLQAGSVGPLARGTIDAMQASEERGLEEGRGSLRPVHAAARGARGAARRASPRSSASTPTRWRSRPRPPTGATSCSPASTCAPTTRSSPRPTSTSGSSGRSTRRARRSSSSSRIRSGSSPPSPRGRD